MTNVAVLSRHSVHNVEILPTGSAKFPATFSFLLNGAQCTYLRALLQCNMSNTRSE